MENNQLDTPEEIEETPINIRELIEKFIGYWPWIVASVVLALILGYFYAHISPRKYQFTASVLIMDQSKSGQMNAMSLMNQLEAVGITSNTSSMVNDEEQVLKSRNLMAEVVNRLHLYVSYYHHHFLRREEIYTASPLVADMDSTLLDSLRYPIQLTITPETAHAFTVTGRYDGHRWEETVHQLPVLLKTPAGNVLLQIRAGHAFPDQKLDIVINNPIGVAKELANDALTTDVGKQTDVVTLTLVTGNVQKGEDILYTLVKLYNDDAIALMNQSAMNTANFINSRLQLLSTDLSNVEHQAQQFKQNNQLIDAKEETKLVLGDANTYQQQLIQVETQLSLINYVEEFLRDPKYHNALVPNLGLTDVGLIEVINAYNKLVLERERIARNASADNPALSSLNHQVEAAREAILTSIANTRKGILITRASLDRQINEIASKIYQVPRQEREFLEIDRQQTVKETLYTFLLQKREEASLQMAVTVPKGRLIDNPNDALQVAPRTSLIMLVFFMLGLAIPILIIYIRDLIDNTIHGRQDVEALTNVPVLSELTHNPSDLPIVDQHNVHESNPELLRLLRTRLQFVLDYPTQKIIMVTSTEPGEGKTFVSVNLAITLSMADKKVLLMGLDLRKPQLNKIFGVPDREGISSYLSGLENDVQKMIVSLPDYPNLDLLPSGMIPPNPNELIMRNRLDELVNEVKPLYDYIVFDTSPVGAVSDTLLLHRLTDVTLYVCRAEYSDRRNLEFVNRLVHEGTLKPLYLLINDVHLERHHNGYRRGYYHYGYGYGHYHHQGEK
ncbi:MAG: GumC family protein [Microbacter sp.]